jgi:hypothetical protein
MASVGGDVARDHRDDSTVGLSMPSSTWMELLAPGGDNFPCSAGAHPCVRRTKEHGLYRAQQASLVEKPL